MARPPVSAVLPALLFATLSGCAFAPPHLPAAAGERAECLEVFRRVDDAVARARVADGMAARVAGFPYLRVNRFLASYAHEDLSEARFADWMNRMAALGAEAYAVEVGNLPIERAEELAHELWNIHVRYVWTLPAIAECTKRLAGLDGGDPRRRMELRGATRVPDEYATWQRIAGAAFARPEPALPVQGRLVTYVPPLGRLARDEAAAILARASATPLGIPDPRGSDLEALFRAHAPQFVVDVADGADAMGELGWSGAGMPQVVSRRPVVYRRASHTRYAGRALLQLNYAIWFPARPKTSAWDLRGGHLDGVLWRVTLAPDGAPWVFDAMHLCGCYHLFIPTARAVAKTQPDTPGDTAFAPRILPRVESGARVVVRLASGTHDLERITLAAGPSQGGIEYMFAEDDTLRSRPLPEGGRRSLFGPDGIVAGTECAGRRHFDDPDLPGRYFTLEREP